MAKPPFAPVSTPIAARFLWPTAVAAVAAALLPFLLGRSGLAQGASCLPPISNPVVCENALPGNPPSEWDVTGAGDVSIQGFATEISVNHGESIDFKVTTDALQYHIDIYRLGYYGGAGARKVATIAPSATLPQNQPACLTDAPTGLIDCGNWAISASWSVPSDATSGVYIGRLVRTDNGGASHMVFIVRDDDHQSDLLFQASDTTWQAYNDYGGNSLYTGSPAGRAYKVSYNRPFATRGNEFARAWLFDGDYPMIRWLEANGYFVSYTTGVDTDRRGAELLEHKAFLSVGHDEYWSAAQRTNVEAARAAGVHLAFFSGDAIFWKTRWENSLAAPATAYRTLVSYKETHANAKIDPSPTWTGTWRDPRFSPPADGGQPENALTGTIFMGNCCSALPLTVSEAQGKNRFWRNTSLATLASGQSADVAPGIVGYEFDADLENGFRPQGLTRLSTTTATNYGQTLLDHGSTYGAGSITHALTMYRHASGALIFSAGLTRWAWALDTTHDQDSATPGILPNVDPVIQQATVNLLADMGSQPLTLQPGLMASDASLDTTAPASTITSPANGSIVTIGTPLTITGTASDAGGVVAAVEVSVDNGATWKAATGLTSWTLAWTPAGLGTVTVKSRAVDDSGNVGAATSVDVTVSYVCPCTLWREAEAPSAFDTSGSTPVELGVKFTSQTGGYITGIRFYKGPTNTGVHTATLWSIGGTALATTTFEGETASGWQQVSFAVPVAIAADTTYVASYFSSTGHFSYDVAYFNASHDRPPLHAPASPVVGGNGVFAMGASGFPTQTFNANNYWVDVVFATTADLPPSITSRTPAPGATAVSPATSITATFSKAMNAGTITGATFELRDPSSTLVPATVSYNATTNVASLFPSGQLAPMTTFTATVVGGASGVKDETGDAMVGNSTWSFTTGGTFPCPCTLWPESTTPATFDTSGSSPLELGVKFTTEVGGFITAVRFYKGLTDAGVHTANLWSATGTLLATAPFTGESASGWQEVALPSAVAVIANTTYVVSYHTTSGFFAFDAGYFVDTGRDAAPLHAPSSLAAGGNGVFSSGATAFPTQTFNGNNYWVDAVFVLSLDTTAPTITARTPLPGATDVLPGATVTLTFSEALNPATITAATFELRDPGNNAVPAIIDYNAGTNVATLTPSAPLGELVTYTATVRGGGAGVRDLVGNPLVADSSWTFTTLDVTAPTVTGMVPAHGAIGVPPTTSVTATFSENVNAATVTSATFELRDSGNNLVPASVGYNSGTHVATLSPASALGSSAVYTARIVGGAGGVKDPSGNPLAGDVTATFTTLDVIAPLVTAVTPVGGATAVPGTTAVTTTFSENMNPSTITAATIELRDASSNLVPAIVSYDEPSRTATLQPLAALAPTTLHTIKVVGGGAADLAGNPVVADVLSAFTTSSVAPVVGVRAIGTYNTNDSNENTTYTTAVTTQAATNLVMFVTGDRAEPPVVSDTYHNVWTQVGPSLAAGGDAQGSQGHLWVMTSIGATGGPNHAFSVLRYTGFSSVLVVEVVGNVVLEGAAFGTDSAAPFTSPAVTIADSALLLGALAIGFPDALVEFAHGNGFAALDFISTGEYWNLADSSRTAWAGTYTTLETTTFVDGGSPDTPYATALLALRTKPPAGDTTAPLVSAVTPTAGAVGVSAVISPTITFSESLDVMTVNLAAIQLRDPANTIVPAAISYDGATRTVTIDPKVSLASFTGYTIRIAAGVKDLAGNALPADVTSSFTTGLALPTIGATVTGAYNRLNSDENITVSTQSITTQPSTNLVMFLAGDDNATIPLPVVSDSYGNTWTQVGTALTNGGGGQGTPGKLWTFVSLGAAGGPNHAFSALNYTSFTSMLVVEVLGDIVLDTSSFGLDEVSPFDSGAITLSREGLLLGAAAVGFPDGRGEFSYANGFQPVNVVSSGENWAVASTARAAAAGAHASSMTYTLPNGGIPDPPAAIALLGFVPESTAPYAVAATPFGESTEVPTNTVLTAEFSERLLPSSVNTSTFQLTNGANDLVPATVTYDDETFTATLTPLADLQHGDTFTAWLAGGPGGITDRSGNPLAFDVTWFFSTAVPSLSVSGVTVAEPIPVPGATSQATFTVSLSHSSASTVTVTYATASGTATSGQDFTAASGILTFAPGVTSLPVSVSVLADAAIEANETLVVTLSAPVNAAITGSQATGVITNTVVPPIGLTTVGTSTDTDDSNYLTGSLVTTTWAGAITSMSVNVGAIDSATNNRRYQVAIYTNNAGRPGTRVALSAAATLVANAWNTVAIAATLQANTSYWLIYNTNGRTTTVNNMKFNVGSAGQGVYSTAPVTFGTFPTTFPASTLTTARYSLYATW